MDAISSSSSPRLKAAGLDLSSVANTVNKTNHSERVGRHRESAAMHVDVNGTRLWFDVDGPALVPDATEMRERPTVVLVHGGPGVWDHSYFKPDFTPLAEHAQVVYLDLRGHGRSDWGDVGAWSFETCADDIRQFCDTVGIASPFVLGHSMGGPIVLLYGARHPGHAAGLIINSGFARFDVPRLVDGFRRVAGDDVADIARRSFSGEEVSDEEWDRVAVAYGPCNPGPEQRVRPRKNLDLNAPGMDLVRTADLVDQLKRVESPTLVLVGELDPVTPPAASEEIFAALPEKVGRLAVIDGAGHWAWKDAPDRYWRLITQFIGASQAGSAR
jgi:pimeloyl-ACP methyl ester carboxylesterase